jgi:hypothetical protein
MIGFCHAVERPRRNGSSRPGKLRADLEVIDFWGPFEVFSVGRIDESRRRDDPSLSRVVLVAETAQPVVAVSGLRGIPDHNLATFPPLDLLVVPGG